MRRVCIVRLKAYPAQKNLRRSAETLVKEGCDVDVICWGIKGEKKHEVINGVMIHRLFMTYHREKIFWYIFDYVAFFILASLKLAKLTMKKRYDVVEVHTMPDFLVFVSLFPKLLGSKVVLYMFENAELLFTSSYGVSPRHIIARLLRFFMKISAQYADAVIVSDGPLHKQAVEECGIPSDKITTVLNVPDDSVFDHQPVPIQDGNHFRLIVVSMILKRYGIITVIQAVPLILKDIPELKVDIIGDGERRPEAEQMARKLGIDGYFNFTGFIPYEKIPPYIARAQVGIAPMIEDVGAPNKIFEYLALGKATVASDLPGIKAVFDDSCVLFFQPGNERELADRILELYHNPAKMDSMARSAKILYEKNHWPVMKQNYLRVYQKL